ncbi:MAG: hypothetical protein AAGF11_18190 [Myxococcota bacterium]
MLQALLHRKLDRWLDKDVCTIEDLLTSVVLGSACYAPHEQALLPFLSRAVDEHGQTLAPHLEGVGRMTAEFWPNWGALEVDRDGDTSLLEDEGGADDEGYEASQGEGDEQAEDGPSRHVSVPACEPEVIIDLEFVDGRHELILVEAKLHSGKSSHPTGGGAVTDQLSKYWLQLEQEAARRNAIPRAVVYLTASSRMPKEELRASQDDLVQASQGRAPLFWLSWRWFADVVDLDGASPILLDCVRLLQKRWMLVTVRMERWPIPPPIPPRIQFRRDFAWTAPDIDEPAWSFDPQGGPHDACRR